MIRRERGERSRAKGHGTHGVGGGRGRGRRERRTVLSLAERAAQGDSYTNGSLRPVTDPWSSRHSHPTLSQGPFPHFPPASGVAAPVDRLGLQAGVSPGTGGSDAGGRRCTSWLASSRHGVSWCYASWLASSRHLVLRIMAGWSSAVIWCHA